MVPATAGMAPALLENAMFLGKMVKRSEQLTIIAFLFPKSGTHCISSMVNNKSCLSHPPHVDGGCVSSRENPGQVSWNFPVKRKKFRKTLTSV
jgi:hypothetical protein